MIVPSGLEPLEPGLWAARHTASVSYRESLSGECFAVEDDSFWFRHRNDCIGNAVERYPPSGLIYDVGGGNGFVAAALVASGHATVVVEPSLTAARNARARGVPTVIAAAFNDAGFAPASLPAVGLFDVLEHIQEDRDFLRFVGELLEPSGRLYLTVPAFARLWSAEDANAGHIRRYRLAELKALLAETGFRVEWATYFFSFLVPPILLFRALPSALGFGKSTDARRRGQEHRPGRLARGILDRLCRWELKRLAAGLPIPFGSSCLIVARNEGRPC